MTRPRVLIEDWLPIQELGIESRREREIASALPPLNFLHVWWARRPLVAAAGTVLASLLPTWSVELRDRFVDSRELASEDAYKRWALRLMGILADPIAGNARLEAFRDEGGKRPSDREIYGYDRAYMNCLRPGDLRLLHQVLQATWGEIPSTLDPTAGGGSIPYVSSRFGLTTYANDINPVAASILRATTEVPAANGPALAEELRRFGSILVSRIEERLAPYFPLANPDKKVIGYLFARTVQCPRSGKPVPLMPNLWLSKKAGKEVAVVIETQEHGQPLGEPRFRVVVGPAAKMSQPDKGTVAGGDGVSIWDGLVIDGDYIKSEAQSGRMGQVIYAVALKGRSSGREFRTPDDQDALGLTLAQRDLRVCLPEWLDREVIPDDEIGISNYDRGHRLYGIHRWRDFFSPRQLLSHATFVEEFQRLVPEVEAAIPESASSVLSLLALMQGKALDYGATYTIWDPSRTKISHVFTKHNFQFKWTYAEFDAGRSLYSWCLDQLCDAYVGIARLLIPEGGSLDLEGARVPRPAEVSMGTAANMPTLEDESQTLICIDPPYYDNVMYGELSDFFGVWEQRTVGKVWSDLVPGGLADIKNEAVANPARFVEAGRKKKSLADADYEAKMGAIFTECSRVLRADGVLTVMFTHKKAEAWDTLGMALMEAGFTIETSWPVNTESEQSLHQAKKNAAASTIMLVCRKREVTTASNPFFEDLEADVRRAARDAVEQFSAAGIGGVDLLLSTYGPALSVISAQWPVYSSEADASGKARLLRPEEALEAAREEVVRLQRRALIGRAVDLDPLTDFTLLAWSTFKAVEFPFDEARRLALAVGGLDVEELVAAKVLTKKAGTVVLLEPKARLRRKSDDKPGVRPDAESFGVPVLDAVHTALYVAAEDGLADAKALIDRAGLANDNRFLACVQGLVNAIPRTKDKGKWVRPEAGLLDALVTAYFPDIEVPEEWTGTLDLGSA